MRNSERSNVESRGSVKEISFNMNNYYDKYERNWVSGEKDIEREREEESEIVGEC